MNRIINALVLCFFALSVPLSAQVGQGGIKGKVLDEKGEPVPLVNVIAKQKGNVVSYTQTDFDGQYTIKPLQPGNYDVEASSVGFSTVTINGIVVKGDKLSYQDFKISSSAVTLAAAEVYDYAVPLIDKDNTTGGETVTRDDISKLPGRSATDVTKTVGGMYSQDDGQGKLNARGARDDANFIYIDGVKMRGGGNLPKAALEQVSVITGGLPAQYGDATGAIISITTRGAAREYAGGVDYLTSGYKIGDNVYGLDVQGYNLLEFNATGPLIWKKDSAGNKKDPILGFFIAGNLNHTVDPVPNGLGNWKLKDEIFDSLNQNPLRFNPGGSGTFLNHSFLRLNDLEKVRTRQNVASQGMSLNAKLDLNINKSTTLTFGGSYESTKKNDDQYRSNFNETSATGNMKSYQLMNSHHNPEFTTQDYRVFARLTQRFDNEGSGKSKGTIKNAYYTIQADYQNSKSGNWDEKLKDNLFAYGFYGKFKTYQAKSYDFGQDSLTGVSGLIHQVFEDTLVAFTPNMDYNPEGALFTQGFYDLYNWQGQDANGNYVYDRDLAGENLRNLNNISLAGGLRNGDLAKDLYSIWRLPAYMNNNYSRSEQEQYRLNAIGSADIGNHALTIGFEYEQRIDRSFDAFPVELWQLGRQLTNRHITNLDKLHPTITQIGTFTQFDYNRLNSAPDSLWGGDFNGADPQYFFDYNLRKKLGLNPDGLDWIDFDSYNPETFSLDMFSADELLNLGSPYVSYYGYDHTGKKKTDYGADWVTKFFTEKDQYGNYKREVAPFTPIYTAGFIQDKFSFDDLVFNVGLRVDRYDANQKVLNDPWVLFPTVKAGEDLTKYGLTNEYNIPGNIGSDYVVYVDNVTSPTEIVGFRDGNVWYNKDGIEISDPSILEGPSGTVSPLLVDKEKLTPQDINETSFKDYKPRTAIMPRISFSFPVSDEALFFAHYDVLSKRPGGGNRLDVVNYFFLNQLGQNVIGNPDLGLERTIDYELGFKQKLNATSALTITSFYREFRDMVNVLNLQQAYPRKYITYTNADFATVKGFTVSYDLRRFGNIRGKVAYTLQFAEGTGSNTTAGLGLARSGKANLRALIPLTFDQRHTIIANVDYRYGAGADYNGPQGFMRKILENFGVNAVFNVGSGTPYSKRKLPFGANSFDGQTSALDGQLNGARLPWNFTINLGVDKSVDLKWGKTESGDAKKVTPLTIYMQIENVLNYLNITEIYSATGTPEDDGYLTAPQFQNQFASFADETSFRQLYYAKMYTGANYSLPRRMKIGVRLDF